MSSPYYKNLQPLRITSGWTVEYNKFMDIEPEELNKNDDKWLFIFVEDILQIKTN